MAEREESLDEREEWKSWLLQLNISKTKIMASGPITSWQLDGGNNGNSDRLYFLWALKSLKIVTAAMKLKHTYSLEGKL